MLAVNEGECILNTAHRFLSVFGETMMLVIAIINRDISAIN